MTTTTTHAETISAQQLRELMGEDPALRILDVRTGGEFETQHIPGSHNVPLDTLGEHIIDLANVERQVVLVCQTGRRADQAHAKLAGAGKEALHILEGGMTAWHAAGGEVIQGENARWAMDRQVRLVAGGLALTGILASTVVPQAKWLAGGIGAGLTFSALSNTCAMGTALSKLPYNRSDEYDIAEVLAELNKNPL